MFFSESKEDSRPETPDANTAEGQEPRVVKDKTLAQVGDLYEIRPEEIDTDELYMMDAARKKYEVRRMLEKSVSNLLLKLLAIKANKTA